MICQIFRSWGCHKRACDELINWFYEESNLKKMTIIVPFDTIFSTYNANLNTPKYKEYFLNVYNSKKTSFKINQDQAITVLSKIVI
ncbi:Uncharacterised protein [Candidatus Tiddalikarchaeum anstoanum]|nr:Uncharacterised protein [Candidatus Tiddalikarchaeum anstoanum]